MLYFLIRRRHMKNFDFSWHASIFLFYFFLWGFLVYGVFWRTGIVRASTRALIQSPNVTFKIAVIVVDRSLVRCGMSEIVRAAEFYVEVMVGGEGIASLQTF